MKHLQCKGVLIEWKVDLAKKERVSVRGGCGGGGNNKKKTRNTRGEKIGVYAVMYMKRWVVEKERKATTGRERAAAKNAKKYGIFLWLSVL